MINKITNKNELISKIQDLKAQNPIIKANSFKDRVANPIDLEFKTLVDDKKDENPIIIKAESFAEKIVITDPSGFRDSNSEVNGFSFVVNKGSSFDLRSIYLQEQINELIKKAEELEDELNLEIDMSGSMTVIDLLAKFREIITKLDSELRAIKENNSLKKSIDNNYLQSVKEDNDKREQINKTDISKGLKKPLFRKPSFSN